MMKYSVILLGVFMIPLVQCSNPWVVETARIIDQVEELTEGAIKFFDQTMENFLYRTTGFIKKAGDSYTIQTFLASQDVIKLIHLSAEDAIAQGADVHSCLKDVVHVIEDLTTNSRPQVSECTSRFISQANDLVEEAKKNVREHEQVTVELRGELKKCDGNPDCLDKLIEKSLLLVATVPDEINLESMDVHTVLGAIASQGSKCVLEITKMVTEEMMNKAQEKILCIYNSLGGK